MEEPTSDNEARPEESSNRTFIIIAVILAAVFILGLAGIGAFAFVVLPGQQRARATENAIRIAQNAATADAATALANVPTNTPVPPTATNTVAPTNTNTPAPSDTPVVPPTDTATAPPTDTLAPSDTAAPASITPGGPTLTPTKKVSATPTSAPATKTSGGGTASPTGSGTARSGTAGAATVTPTKLPSRTASPTGSVATATPIAAGGSVTATQLPATGFADQAGVPNLIIVGLALIAIVIIARRLRYSLR